MPAIDAYSAVLLGACLTVLVCERLGKIKHNLGKDLVRHYVETSGGAALAVERKWQAFERLLASPMIPSDLRSGD